MDPDAAWSHSSSPAVSAYYRDLTNDLCNEIGKLRTALTQAEQERDARHCPCCQVANRAQLELQADLARTAGERDELAARVAEPVDSRLRRLDVLAEEMRATHQQNQRVFAFLHAELTRIRNEGRPVKGDV